MTRSASRGSFEQRPGRGTGQIGELVILYGDNGRELGQDPRQRLPSAGSPRRSKRILRSGREQHGLGSRAERPAQCVRHDAFVIHGHADEAVAHPLEGVKYGLIARLLHGDSSRCRRPDRRRDREREHHQLLGRGADDKLRPRSHDPIPLQTWPQRPSERARRVRACVLQVVVVRLVEGRSPGPYDDLFQDQVRVRLARCAIGCVRVHGAEMVGRGDHRPAAPGCPGNADRQRSALHIGGQRE